MSRFARLLRLLLVPILAVGPGFSFPAFAHTRSETHSAWQIQGSTVHLQFTVPDLESKRLTPDGDMPSVEQLGSYVADHVGALSGDQACKMTEGPRPLATPSGYRRYELSFECPDADNIKVRSSAWCPNVMVPRQTSDTFSPVWPRRRLFMALHFQLLSYDGWCGGAAPARTTPAGHPSNSLSRYSRTSILQVERASGKPLVC